MTAKVTFTNATRWRLGQVLTPFAMIVGILSRRFWSPALSIAAGAAGIAVGVIYLSARRSFGRRDLALKDGILTLGRDAPAISSREVVSWTMDNHKARIYMSDGGWCLRSSEQQGLRDLLEAALGAPLRLRPRGSSRARKAALACALGALAMAGFGIGADLAFPAIVGLPIALVAFATLGALSQKVVDPGSQP